MYSFLLPTTLTAKPLPENSYQFFTYNGKSPVTVTFRGKELAIRKGDRFGVRPSTSGKFIRLIFPNDPNRVLTIDSDTAKKLSKGVTK